MKQKYLHAIHPALPYKMNRENEKLNRQSFVLTEIRKGITLILRTIAYWTMNPTLLTIFNTQSFRKRKIINTLYRQINQLMN